MPELDARKVYEQAEANRKRRETEDRKKFRRRMRKQKICARNGCWNTGPFRLGLCEQCYNMLKGKRQKGVRGRLNINKHDGAYMKPGITVLVSGSYPNPEYRGRYGILISLEDGKAVAVVELTGDDSSVCTSDRVKADAGKRLHLLTEWLLPVER